MRIKKSIFTPPLSCFLIVLCLFSCLSKKRLISKAKSGTKASELAQKVQDAVGIDCWDTLNIVEWTFANRHHLWDRKRQLYQLTRKGITIQLDLSQSHKGIITKNGKTTPASSKKLKKAYHIWANDSFWLNPFDKFYDQGVARYYYKDTDSLEHLIINYQSNGRFKDLYDWTIDSTTYLPTHWNLWVKIIPFKNFAFTWEKWHHNSCSWKTSLYHHSSLLSIHLKGVHHYQKWSSSPYAKDPFTLLLSNQ